MLLSYQWEFQPKSKLERTFSPMKNHTAKNKQDKKKEKPSYSTWQNVIFMLKSANKTDKRRIPVMILFVISSVLISVAELFLPKTIIEQIENTIPVEMLIFTLAGFIAVIIVLQVLKQIADTTKNFLGTAFRIKKFEDIILKTATTDYINLENNNFTLLKSNSIESFMGDNSVYQAIFSTMTGLSINLISFIVYLILLTQINPVILLIIIATTLISYFIRRTANKWRYANDKEKHVQENRMEYVARIGIEPKYAKDMRLFQISSWFKEMFLSALLLADDWEKRAEKKQFLADLFDCLMTFIREGFAYGYLIFLVINDGLVVSEFVLLFSAIGGFSAWIMGLSTDVSELHKQSLEICRIREFTDYKECYPKYTGERIEQNLEKFDLELKDVSFRHLEAEKDTINSINLKIKSCEKLAIVGLNGAGKTTLIKLITGLYQPSGGKVLFNGKDVQSLNRLDYYNQFTAVFQEFNIMPITIAETISQEKDSEIDIEKLKHCIEMAGLTEKINSLPDKCNSLLLKNVFDNAVELSGGETQRLMLARALYKNSSILILDEPTAALDPIAEDQIYQRYNELSKGKTSIYISHRLASTRFCDRIIYLEDGEIVEVGTHDELMDLKGKYHELFSIQSKYYKDEIKEIDEN